MKTVPNRHRQESLKINIFQKNQGLSEVSVRDFPGACAGKRPLTDTSRKASTRYSVKNLTKLAQKSPEPVQENDI